METGDEQSHEEFQPDAPQMFKGRHTTNPSSLGSAAKL